jgi:hypothetical protein
MGADINSDGEQAVALDERDLRNSVIHDKVTGGYRFRRGPSRAPASPPR